jgi:hypothetical protein
MNKLCPLPHIPNAVTKKALDDVKIGKNLHRATSIEDLLKKLNR